MPSRVLPSVCVHGQSAAADSLIFDSYAGLHSFHTSSCPDLPTVDLAKVPGPWAADTRGTASRQPGRVLQLTDGRTSGSETGSATSFLHSLHEAQLCWRPGSPVISAAKGVQRGRPSGLQDH